MTRIPAARPRALTAVLLLLAGLLLGLASPASAQEAGAGGPVVDVVEIDGVIDGSVAAYVRDTIEKANAEGAQLVAITLDTPGGIGGAGQEIVIVTVPPPV